ncbi:hypothetical protein SynBIOSE41_03292 [Synechococcus sp. BIOS-E4-1]|nr:hypothetical protein SynBIOSE41_03292 [Synechococcus sp. BIOS-E4-1]
MVIKETVRDPSILSLLIKAPATAGAFYFFNYPKKTTN